MGEIMAQTKTKRVSGAAKKKTTSRTAPKKAAAKSSAERPRSQESPALKNLLARLEKKNLVPERLRGNDNYLDIVTWNIRYFSHTDPQRVQIIERLMSEINADIFVLQEIEEFALNDLARRLAEKDAGQYRVHYGTTGDDQRVAIMYDRDWVKLTSTPLELFGQETELKFGRSHAFPRLPLHASFYAYGIENPFLFELIGVHLKSKVNGRGSTDNGFAQRSMAAKRLALWLESEAVDDDVIIAGDWNATANEKEWTPLLDQETTGTIHMSSWNPDGEGSYLVSTSQRTRIDLFVVTEEAARQAVRKEKPEVIEWNDILEMKGVFGHIKKKISDHLPVLCRFYFTEKR